MVTSERIQAILASRLYLFVGFVSLLQILLFPTPAEMSDFMIGCSIGNFRPSSTCEAVCRLLHNRTSCCYGVNYDSRAVCACCNLNTNGACPTVCSGHCHIITLNAGNCSELRGGKHRSGAGGPSIINDLSILSDHPGGSRYKPLQSPRAEMVDEDGDKSSKNSSSVLSSKHKNSLSTTNKLFQRLSTSLDLL